MTKKLLSKNKDVKQVKEKKSIPTKGKKTTLESKAKENTTVVKKAEGKETTLKEGTPLEHSMQHFSVPNVVGVNVGVTKNMSNYESLRVDCWITDIVPEDKTREEVIGELFEVAQVQVATQVQEIME